MEKTTIIIYIDNKPYKFQIEIDEKVGTTTYYVTSNNSHDISFIPDQLEFDIDGVVKQKNLLKTIEQEQIARMIWQEILNKLKP
jgi:hypothetical protein